MTPEDKAIRTHLQSHALRYAKRSGGVLEQHDPATGWAVVARLVPTLASALAVAITLGLCPPLSAAPAVSDANFATAPAGIETPQGGIIKLAEYQKRYIADKSRIKVACWARQTGKDFCTALEAILDAMETGQRWYIVSLTQRQALATAQKAQMHARAIEGVLPKITEEEIGYDRGGEAFRITMYGVRLKNGGEVIALPGKDPDVLAGLTGNVIFTEMALFPNNGVDHWRVVFPLTTRGFKLRAISTPRGPQTKFSELRRNAAGKYSVHNVTIVDAVAQGMELRDETGKPIAPADLEAIYADPEGWSREYMCCEGEDHQALIEWSDIANCEADYTIPVIEIKPGKNVRRTHLHELFDEFHTTLFAEIRAKMTGLPVLGDDIGVTGDLAVLAYGEKLGDVTWLRALVLMHGVDDFDYQEEIAMRAMDTGATGVGDKTGLGREMCQRLELKYGESRFKGLVFTATDKTALFVQLRDAAQGARLRIPRGLEIVRYDLHALARRGVGVAERLQVLTLRNPLLQRSHADIATAIAMMIDAGISGGKPFTFQPLALPLGGAVPLFGGDGRVGEHPLAGLLRGGQVTAGRAML